MLRLTRSIRTLSTGTPQSIGFIGLGQMGYPMASNLITKLKPKEFIVHDHSSDTSQAFVNEHKSARVAYTPKEVAEQCDMIVTMLPASLHVRSVYTGDNGLIHGLKPSTMVIDSSTIDPSTTKELSAILKQKEVEMLDAPVSGGTLGAQAGTLTFMVGSNSKSAFEDSKYLLQHMGKNIAYCGTNGNGQIAKICNNMLLGITMMGAAETMNLGVSMGMDPKLLASIINTSTGRSWSTEIYNPCPGVIENAPSSRDYSGGFGVALMAKDMGLAVQAANEAKVSTTLGAIAHQIYKQISGLKDYERKDFSSVYKWLRQK